jgi:serine/threonine protein kinase
MEGDAVSGRLEESIGPYRILERIAEGAATVVYLAQKTEGMPGIVALKTLKVGNDSKESSARLQMETQALALFQHPNVVRIYDGGVTESGRHFFAMDYVEGPSITRYCDAQRLDLERRLSLFIDVCRAVHHCHARGVIHRDIEPANIPVAARDGVPKLIDFNWARAAPSFLTEPTTFPNPPRRLIGKRSYMSPEQAVTSGSNVDGRSDVYSLGVLLYELLTGTTPLDQGLLERLDYEALLQTVCEEEPPRPSDRVLAIPDKERISVDRHTNPKALSRPLRGDLDDIAMKALEKDRAHRWQSAGELAHAVENLLKVGPIRSFRRRWFWWF